ncbi:conserved phage C-terminal domain-containing protein [Neobacillus sp. C211]|uniref:conserved phage C-terminal domain-containing protein n=1 Tax=unclassified Neobacillus TaxID=2675272 RepID=UPI00397CB74E
MERPAKPIEENTPEEEANNTKVTTVSSSVKKEIPYAEIINYLNEITGKNFKPGSIKTREMIHARNREGFTFEEFKKVIDLKTAEWKFAWNKFLRLETLFGTKFESYLNQQERKKRMSEEDFNFDESKRDL